MYAVCRVLAGRIIIGGEVRHVARLNIFHENSGIGPCDILLVKKAL